MNEYGFSTTGRFARTFAGFFHVGEVTCATRHTQCDEMRARAVPTPTIVIPYSYNMGTTGKIANWARFMGRKGTTGLGWRSG